MKNCLSIILFLSLSCYSQVTKITYTLELAIDESKTINKERLERDKAINNALKGVIADLIFDKSISKFSTQHVMSTDNKSVLDAVSLFNLEKPIYFYQGNRYEYGVDDLMKGGNYMVKSEIMPWKLHKDTMTIAGYKCYKATNAYSNDRGVFENTAWYCPAIKGSFGPGGIGNLPGAALIYQHANRVYKAKSVTLNVNEKITFPTDAKIISEKEYDELWRKWEEAEFGN